MAYAFIAGNGAGASANNDTVTTSAIDTSGANLLVAVAAFLNNITANPTLSDSKSNTWTLIHSRIHSILEVRIYAAIGSPTVGSGHTITLDGTNTNPSVHMAAFSGAAASPDEGQDNGADDGGPVASIQLGAITPVASGALVVTGVCSSDNVGSGTQDQSINLSYSIASEVPTGSNAMGSALAYLILPGSPSSQAPTWSSTPDYDPVVSIITSFAPGAAGGVPPLAWRGSYPTVIATTRRR